MDNVLRMQIKLDAAPARVYDALTDDAALATWFTEFSAVDVAGGAYDFWGRFTPGAPTREQGKHPVSDYRAGHLLSYDWTLPNGSTNVRLMLRERAPDVTMLTLHHANAEVGQHHTYALAPEDFWFLSLENLRRYLDGKPSDARVDFSQSMKGDITHVIDIDADAGTVFDVLLSPKQLERWIASQAAVEPHIGGSIDLGWGVGPIKILDLQPNQKLAYEWNEDGTTGQMTTVTWTLEEGNGRTRLTFTHSGFDDDTDNSGIYPGWRNFQSWVRSVAEYGDNWQPAIKLLTNPDHAAWYPKAINDAQALFADEAVE
ncbi:MAG: SRPBCC domain-containing protein [Anaerolineae bacterium]|nr:SRPBCC domain-containing protein [Anaerolineae bacterium]